MTLSAVAQLSRHDSAPRSQVEDLEVAYIVRGIPREVLRGVSFRVAPGEAYGLVGESGCGKSTTAYAAAALPAAQRRDHRRPRPGRRRRRHAMSDRELREFRATQASMVYQDPARR